MGYGTQPFELIEQAFGRWVRRWLIRLAAAAVLVSWPWWLPVAQRFWD
jgi:hypothetical protein